MEIWKEVVGDSRYEVSSLGSLRVKDTGEILTTCMKRVMSQNGKDYRYRETNRCIQNQTNKKSRPYVHHIVARAFLDWNGTGIVRFRNGDTSDCSVDNLFVTSRTDMLAKNKTDRINKSRESYFKKEDYPKIGTDRGYFRIRLQVEGEKFEVRRKEESDIRFIASEIRKIGGNTDQLKDYIRSVKNADKPV
jgi:hypothetical protein